MLEASSLVALADQEIRNLILAGDLLPGQRVIEARLGERLGISRPPLREAMRMLAVRGILEQTPRRGYRVSELTGAELAEMYSLRAKLDEFAVELAVPAFADSDLVRLDALMAQMWQAARGDEVASVLRLSTEFHIALVGLAGHGKLSQVYRMMIDQMLLCMARGPRVENRPSDDLFACCRCHEILLDSVRLRDLDRIRAALARHSETACPVY